jgi:hypothetical protein
MTGIGLRRKQALQHQRGGVGQEAAETDVQKRFQLAGSGGYALSNLGTIVVS